MRRFAGICCLAALLCGSVAQAKSLLIYQYNTQASVNNRRVYVQSQRNLRNVLAVIRATGGSVTPVRSDRTRTEWGRSGQQVWGTGAGAYVEAFDATIHLGEKGNAAVAFAGQFRPDSVLYALTQANATTAARGVPLLEIVDQTESLLQGSPWASNTDSVPATAAASAGGIGVHIPGDHYSFLAAPKTLVATTPTSGSGVSIREMLMAGTPAIEALHSAPNGNQGCVQCDSLGTYTATPGIDDSCAMLEVQFHNTIALAQNATLLTYGSTDAADSTGSSNIRPELDGDLTLLLCGLVHIDSLTGHKVLGDKIIKIAPVVYGGGSRQNSRRGANTDKGQGISPGDSTQFYAFMDSTQAYGIPMTWCFNVDSAAAYARDVIKLKSHALYRFTPQVFDGIADTTLTAYSGFPKDIFGRFTKRAAYGDSAFHYICNGGADSSIYWQTKRARMMCDSIFGGRTSNVAVAPSDDWSPKQITGVDAGGTGIDSVLYALQQAGFQGVIADAQDPDCGPSHVTNPRGYYNRQRLYTSATIPTLQNFKILCHTGFMTTGSQAQVYAGKDSTGALAKPYIAAYQEIYRVWAGALLDMDRNYQLFPYDATDANERSTTDNGYNRQIERVAPFPLRHGNIMRLSCADLSGQGGANGPPAGNGWIALKSINNAMRIINKLAGRTVVAWAYPEDIDP